MDYEDKTVEPQDTEPVEDDAQFEGLEEEADDSSLSLEDALKEESQENAPDQQPEEQGTGDAGWLKKRINKAVEKAVAATEARMKEQYEKQFAPIMAKMLEQEAKDLVRQGEFKSLDRAKEYLQLKQGVTPEPEPAEQPRNEKGQFANSNDAVIKAKADMLASQADKILRNRGIDVMAEFNADEEIREKIVSGEWDFYDLANELSKQSTRKKAPAPLRSSNGAGGSSLNAIDSMTDEQFERMERNIREKGARYTLRN